MPMLTRVDSGARVWQPPENLKAIGGGAEKMSYNLIANPGFETVGTGWNNVTDADFITGEGSIKPHSGARYVLCKGTANIISEPFKVTPGATLHASAWFYSPAQPRIAGILIVFNDGTTQKSILNVSTGWTRIGMDCTVPSGASIATIELYSGAWKRFDDVEVTEEI